MIFKNRGWLLYLEKKSSMRILDKYILKSYLKNFIIINFSFSVIFVIVDVFDRLHVVLRYNPKLEDAILYYFLNLPYVFIFISPVVVLLSSLFLMNVLSKYNETVAIRSSGISILRMVLPLLLFGLFYSVFILGFGEYVLPKSQYWKDYTYNVKIKGKKMEDVKRRANIFYKSESNLLFSIGFFDGYSEKLYDVDITTYDSTTGGVAQKITAEYATWDGEQWVFFKCFIRTFEQGVPIDVRRYERNKIIPEVDVEPVDFIKSAKKPFSMNYFELLKYIERLKKTGEKFNKQLVDLHTKIAFPFSNIIILFFSIPLASTSTRSKGRGLIFMIGLMVCFLYLAALRVSQNLGYIEILSPNIAAWLPNIIFGIVGIIFMLKAEV